jgi:hypothetical protein
MINEFRRYKVKPGRVGEYIALFEELGLPVIARHLELVSFWTSDTGALNWVFHLWRFENLERRAEQYAALRADPDYAQFRPLALALVEEMHSTLLTPVKFAKFSMPGADTTR